MLTAKHCRELIPPDSDLSDPEIELLRDQLYVLARVVTEHFDRMLCSGVTEGPAKPENFRAAMELVSNDQKVITRERAAIMEFEGNLSRDEAERLAVMLFLSEGTK